MLEREFSLHPLVVEDLQHRHQRPKVELYRDQAFVVLRPILDPEADEAEELEVHALVGPRHLVSIRYDARYDLSEAVHRWERQADLLALGGGFAVYVMIDEVVDDYLTLVERLEDRADELEDMIFATDDGPADVGAVQERLFRLKRECVRLRRAVMPLRQGLDLLQEQPALAAPALAPYYRDVVDHVIRTVELVDNIRDLLDLDARGSRGPGGEPPERGDEEAHRLGGDHPRAHADRRDLRHELRQHAGAPVAGRAIRSRWA